MAGHEERRKINFAKVAIDILRLAEMPQEGIMETQVTKDYKIIETVRPALTNHYAKVSEYLGVSYAFYYGFSWNVLQSSRFSGNSQNILDV